MSDEELTARILVIADDLLTRTGLASLLADESNCTVVGQVGGEVHALTVTIGGRPWAVQTALPHRRWSAFG
jgi:hypothetical protein